MTQLGRWVLGFHGCELSVAEPAISQGVHLRPSENSYDWLGHGIYFWENDPDRALEWAQRVGKNSPAVVGAVIELGHCLELTEAAHLNLVKNSYDFLRDTIAASSGLDALPSNEPGFEGDADLVKRSLDCMVINTLHQSRAESGEQPFDTVRSPFVEGEQLYEGAGIKARTHTQVCVRDTKQILGYFKPLF